VTLQLPIAENDTTEPEIEQLPITVNLTDNPEELPAETAIGPGRAWLATGEKVMLCAAFTVIVLEPVPAAKDAVAAAAAATLQVPAETAKTLPAEYVQAPAGEALTVIVTAPPEGAEAFKITLVPMSIEAKSAGLKVGVLSEAPEEMILEVDAIERALVP
jgi:hypothetical protein